MKNKYLQQFFDSACMASIAPVFDNYKKPRIRDKEITESMGCLNAATQYSGFDPSDPEVKVIVVGDGIRPRTGLIFAYHTLWDVVSLDPLMDTNWFSTFSSFRKESGHPIRRCRVQATKIEDVEAYQYSKKQIIVLPHSHAPVVNTLKVIQGKSVIINLPCCVRVDDRLKAEAYHKHHGYTSYIDDQILSGKREINIWKDIQYDDLPYKMLDRSEVK